jgi:hypothetical protein
VTITTSGSPQDVSVSFSEEDFDLPFWHHRDGIHLVIWCKFCRVYHRHGAGGGDGARTEHCWNPNSGYRGFGYVLKTDLGIFPKELERDARKRRPEGPYAVALSEAWR